MSPLKALQQTRAELAAEITMQQTRLEGFDQAIAILSGQAPQAQNLLVVEKTSRGFAPRLPAPPHGNCRIWTEADCDRLRELWAARTPTREIAETLNRSISAVQSRAWILELPKRGRIATRKPPDRVGKPKIRIRPTGRSNPPKTVKAVRRFNYEQCLKPEKVKGLPKDHAAITEGRTLFPTTVVNPEDSPRLLVSGQNSKKIGSHVTKGPWSGMPIYMLTLEERATCPERCHHWRTCYGNGMPRARRHKHGPELVAGLAKELSDMSVQFPGGFVVRLHQLGDFYSNEYVCSWWLWLNEIPSLHIFGYTAHGPKTKIGVAITELNRAFKDRCFIRFSGPETQPMGATTIWRKARGRVAEGTVCPAQTGDTDCCGTCGLCWNPNARDICIVFVAHGPSYAGRPPKIVADPKRNVIAQKPWPAEEQETAEPVAGHKPFRKSLDRRCDGCQRIFSSKHPNDTTCALCLKKNSAGERAAEQTRFASAWSNEKFAAAIAASGGRYEDDARAELKRDIALPPADVTAALMGDPAPGRSAA